MQAWDDPGRADKELLAEAPDLTPAFLFAFAIWKMDPHKIYLSYEQRFFFVFQTPLHHGWQRGLLRPEPSPIFG